MEQGINVFLDQISFTSLNILKYLKGFNMIYRLSINIFNNLESLSAKRCSHCLKVKTLGFIQKELTFFCPFYSLIDICSLY